MRIRISRLAAYKTQQLLDYLEEQWSSASKKKFLKIMTQKFEVLKQNPKAYPQSEIRPDLRKLVISKQTSVLYKLTDDSIFIVTLFDNRQHPGKTEKEITKYFG